MDTTLSWSPSRAVFVRRSLIIGAITFVVFMAVVLLSSAGTQQYLMVSALMPFALTLIFFIDDYMRWRQIRDETWQIADGQLIHDGQDGRAMIPLAEIASVKPRLGNALVIKLTSGQRIMMRYLGNPDEILRHLEQPRPPDIA